MKIAVPSNRPDLDGIVANKPGSAAYLLMIETDDMSFEAMKGPPRASGPGAGVMALSQMVDAGAKALLMDHVDNRIADALRKQDIIVVTNVSGTVRRVVAEFMEADPKAGGTVPRRAPRAMSGHWVDAARKGARQFYSLLPKLIGVVLLLGLFQSFVSKEKMLSLFSGNSLTDAFCGALAGSFLAGNAVNSYVVGDGLLKAGVNLSGVLALMMAWVSVGLIQLPAEAEALGLRFAAVRNLAGFLTAILLSYLVGSWLGGSL